MTHQSPRQALKFEHQDPFRSFKLFKIKSRKLKLLEWIGYYMLTNTSRCSWPKPSLDWIWRKTKKNYALVWKECGRGQQGHDNDNEKRAQRSKESVSPFDGLHFQPFFSFYNFMIMCSDSFGDRLPQTNKKQLKGMHT